MSVRKLFVLSAAGALATVAASAALAGGPDMAMPVAPGFQPVAYIEGQIGYNFSDWSSLKANPGLNPPGGPQQFLRITNGGTGSFSGGGDVGFQWCRNFAVEAGALYLQSVSGTNRLTNLSVPGGWATTTGNSLHVTSWLAYTALRVIVPIYDGFDLFGKFGVGSRFLSWTGQGVTGFQSEYYFTPVFAGGASYNFMQNWTAGVQYMYVPGHYDGGTTFNPAQRSAPEANIVTAFAGYGFAV